MSTVPGLYVTGEANFSDHGANRLGASALMQGLADGYFILPYTIGDYLSDDISTGPIPNASAEFFEAEKKASIRGRAIIYDEILDSCPASLVDFKRFDISPYRGPRQKVSKKKK